MHAAYSTVLRHIRHREDAYQAILRSVNCLTTTEEALPSRWEWELAGWAASSLWSTLKTQIRLLFLSFKLTSLKAFTLNLSAFHRMKACFFKIKKAAKDHSKLKAPHLFTNCPPAVPMAASSAGRRMAIHSSRWVCATLSKEARGRHDLTYI